MPPPCCQVCVGPMPPTRRFSCPFCEYVCCKSCVQTYILGLQEDARCMSCGRALDREVLAKGLSQSFVRTELKRHRENLLLEREQAMMPATQKYVTQELQRRENVQLLEKLCAERNRLRNLAERLDQSCREVQARLVPPLQRDRREFVHRCAQPGCRGYLSSAWKCGICNKYTCGECNAPRGFEREDGHTCRDEDKRSMQLIRLDSRPCPGCGEFIHKISGCDQMWCTSCHTAFSWRTGQRLLGQLHNPHFYEYQQRHGGPARELGDIPCGGMPSSRELFAAMRQAQASEDVTKLLSGVHRLATHIEFDEMPRYRANQIDEQSNVDLRVKYMLAEITAPVFKEKLQQREKKTQKMNDIHMVLVMFNQTISEMLRGAVLMRRFDECAKEARTLIDYYNESLRAVSTKYACVVPSIGKELRISKTKA